MERVCLRDKGLFPSPKDIKLSCSCPDWADMCKHVAAVLYGVGARLDASPELLFTLRGLDKSGAGSESERRIACGEEAFIQQACYDRRRSWRDSSAWRWRKPGMQRLGRPIHPLAGTRKKERRL